MNDKISFITDLLSSNKINASQKERLLILATSEIKNIGNSDEVIFAEIQLLKSKIREIVENKNVTNNNHKSDFNFKTNKKLIMTEEEQEALDNMENYQNEALDEYNNQQLEGQEAFENMLDNQDKALDEYYEQQQEAISGSYDLNNAYYKDTKSTKNDNYKKNLPLYLNPKDLRDFLIDYNQDSVLKYTCHEIDDQERFQNLLDQCKSDHYEFEKHLEKIHKVFNKLTFKFQKKVNYNLIVLIARYLGTYEKELTWSENNINVKWSYPGLLQWSIANSGKVPNPSDAFQVEKFRFNTIELNNGNSIANFSELVIYFKNLFHFKDGNTLKSKLEETIFMNFQSDQYNIRFDNEFSERIELFTYSETLMQTFVKIINQKYHKDNFQTLDVKLYFNYDCDKLKEFKIVILNSKEFGKHYTGFRLGDDFTDLINKQINGLCDFYIKAYFEDQNSIGLVNIWNGKPMKFIPTDEKIDGVEFILKMY